MGDQGSVYLSPTALRSGPDNKAILALGSFCQIKRCHSLHDIMNFSTVNAFPAQVCSRNVDISTQPWRPDQLPAHSTPDATQGLVPAAPQPALSCLKSKRWHSLHTLLPAWFHRKVIRCLHLAQIPFPLWPTVRPSWWTQNDMGYRSLRDPCSQITPNCSCLELRNSQLNQNTPRKPFYSVIICSLMACYQMKFWVKYPRPPLAFLTMHSKVATWHAQCCTLG